MSVRISPYKHTVSRLFQPVNLVSKSTEVKYNDITSKSQKLMIDNGIIHQANNGMFDLLPLGQRALQKLINLVDHHMQAVGAQKVTFPLLTNSTLWKSTNRLESSGPELFMLQDRHKKNYILSPTQEENAAHLMASIPMISYKQLPLLLYQINSKFRDEGRPRFGLIRTKEFLMKDLYSFDEDVEIAKKTYNMICKTYEDMFDTIGVKYTKVLAATGMMGGSLSHEFHYTVPVGEDTLLICNKCNYGVNKEVDPNKTTCDKCSESFIETKGIEVGHTFLLGTKYSEPLNAYYASPKGKKVLYMGSYGLGLTRILAACLEVISLPDEIRWPQLLAPYLLLIITPKAGSKEEKVAGNLGDELYMSAQQIPGFCDNVIIDDRSDLTVGNRLLKAKKTGYPYIVVIGKSVTASPEVLELHDLNRNQCLYLSKSDLLHYISNNNSNGDLFKTATVA